MDWIYLSPHFDDIAFSCGGLVWEQVEEGNSVSIWTICAADPPEGDLSEFAAYKHITWETNKETVHHRRREDQASCALMGARPRYFPFQDCIYRQDPLTGSFLYDSEESLWGAIHPSESILLERLISELIQVLPENAQVVSPLALGNHVDHQLTRKAAELLNRPLWYYADFPYVIHMPEIFINLTQKGWTHIVFPISKAGMSAWENAVAAHASQISTFWSNEFDMQKSLRNYRDQVGGIALWRSARG